MIYNLLTLIITTTLILTGCGSKGGPDLSPEASRKTIKTAPDWMLNPSDKQGFVQHSSTATSQDIQMALDKARTSAATTLAGLIESEWNEREAGVKPPTRRRGWGTSLGGGDVPSRSRSIA